MKISTITLLFVVLVLQTHSTFNFGFDVNRANAVLNAGSCYLQPGVYQSAKNDVAVRYYNLPYGWRQYQDRIVIPSVLGQKGNFNLGVKAISGSDSVNQQFNVAVNGLSIKVSPASSSSSKNLVIGSNYRTDSLNDKQYSSLVSSISKGQYWVNDPSQFWVYGSNPGVRYFGNNQDEYKRSRSTFSTSGSSSSGNINNLGSLNDLIFGYEDSRQADTIRNNIIYSNTPSQVTITNGASSNLRQALNQQFTITSSLTEVNRLIEQLTSNVNSVTSSISKLQTSYNQYKQTSSSCNDKVLELSNTKLRAQTEINGLTDQVSTWKSQLADLTPALNSLIQRRSQLVRQRDQIQRTTPNAASINQIESQFNRCNSDIENTRNQFTRIQGTLQQNNNKISELEASASNAPQQIQLATDQLNVVRQTISDLQAKLSEARSQQKKLQQDIAGYNSAIRTSSSQIESIRNQNSRLTSQISSFQSNIDSQTLRCSELKTQSEQIRNSIATKQQDYQDLNNQISVQDDLISAKRSEVQKLQSSSSSLPSALAKLQSDLTNAEVAVSRQFFICNQANDNVARVDNEIKAAQLRLQTEKKFLNDAQTKLATLTTQKRTIDDLVAKLQSSVSTSTTTTGSFTGGSSTGNVFGSTGTVYGVSIGGNTGIRGGNTGGVIVSQGGSLGGSLGGIAGSISSEINNALSNALGAFFAPTTVGSFSSYIQRLYSLKPEDYRGYISVPSAYQTMYSINPVTWKALSGESLAGSFYQNGKLIMGGSSGSGSGSSRSSSSSSYLGNFGCSSTSGSGSSSGVTSGYGIVTSVQPGYIIVKSRNGESVNLRVGSCSRIEANQPNYVVSVSDKLFYKGKQSKPNNFELHDCTVATY